MTALTGEVVKRPIRPISERRALKLAKDQAEHARIMDYWDRAMGLLDRALPIATNPMVMTIAAHYFLEWQANEARKKISNPIAGLISDAGYSGLLGTIDAAFIANAFGGAAGISKIIGALK